jgi:homocysteine S-methyltransferase
LIFFADFNLSQWTAGLLGAPRAIRMVQANRTGAPQTAYRKRRAARRIPPLPEHIMPKYLMPKYRADLPQLSDKLFLTDAGMETFLIFHEGVDLPYFASFDLMKDDDGIAHVRRYYERFIAMARKSGLGFVLESPTWRANRDWAGKLGYAGEKLADVNRRTIALMAEMRDTFETPDSPIVISANIGPRGDGYAPDHMMSAREAEAYHAEQIAVFRDTEADLVSAFTLNYTNEAIGIAHAAKAARMPVVLSFTVETDGRLPTGQTLKDAIIETDAKTGAAAAYYMLNCAHPTHFEHVLANDEPWVKRLRGLRANASTRSHAELDASTDLDAGDPVVLGQQYRALRGRLPQLTILGGCCGTDHRHVEQICFACTAEEARKVA